MIHEPQSADWWAKIAKFSGMAGMVTPVGAMPLLQIQLNIFKHFSHGGGSATLRLDPQSDGEPPRDRQSGWLLTHVRQACSQNNGHAQSHSPCISWDGRLFLRQATDTVLHGLDRCFGLACRKRFSVAGNANLISKYISMLEISVSKTLYYLRRWFSVLVLIQNTISARVKTLFMKQVVW